MFFTVVKSIILRGVELVRGMEEISNVWRILVKKRLRKPRSQIEDNIKMFRWEILCEIDRDYGH